MKRRAFILAEVLLGVAILGIAGVALLQLMASGTKSNSVATAAATAVALADNVHDFAMRLSCKAPTGAAPSSLTDSAFTNVCYLDQKTFYPIDAQGNTLVDSAGGTLYPNYRISCRVYSYDLATPGTTTTATDTNLRRLYVTVSYNNQPVYNNTWIMAASK